MIDTVEQCNGNFTTKRAVTQDMRDIAYALRYEAYRSIGAIPENSSKTCFDAYDAAPNTITYLLYYQEEVIGSGRVCIYSSYFQYRPIPSFQLFRDEIASEIGLDNTIVEGNRFVIKPTFSKKSLKALLHLFRAGFTDTIAHNADYIIAAIKEKDFSFYQRFFLASPISSVKTFQDVTFSTLLVASNFKNNYDSYIRHRHPILALNPQEVKEVCEG